VLTLTAPTVPVSYAIVIGASAGGVRAVGTLLHGLLEKIPAAIFVVIHTSPDGPGLLSTVFNRATPLTVVAPHDGELIRAGHVYVAPPDYHLIVGDRHIHLNHGPREHRFRPAIDPLFRTAAEHYGPRTIGAVLSGHMADGIHGLKLIKKAGGVTFAQDPDEAEVPAMPLAAMRQVAVDYVLPVEEMARVIVGLLLNSRRGTRPMRLVQTEKPNAERPGTDALRTKAMRGVPSPFTCPDCGGSLWEIKEGKLIRYRCHVGHGFTIDSLRDGMDTKVEEALWTALRATEEAIELRGRMRARAKGQQLSGFISQIDTDISELKHHADALRGVLLEPQKSATRRKTPRTRKAHG
jgi:two-component system, chemotaxis family, protein-glutamate methylesterase/glutaminase